MSALEEAFATLTERARLYSAEPSRQSASSLCDAALAYAVARWASKTAPARSGQPRTAKGLLVPFGKQKGELVSETQSRELRWLLGVLEDRLNEPGRERFRAENQQLIDVVRGELEQRGDI